MRRLPSGRPRVDATRVGQTPGSYMKVEAYDYVPPGGAMQQQQQQQRYQEELAAVPLKKSAMGCACTLFLVFIVFAMLIATQVSLVRAELCVGPRC